MRHACSAEQEAVSRKPTPRGQGRDAVGLGQACSVPPVAFWPGPREDIVSPSKPARGAEGGGRSPQPQLEADRATPPLQSEQIKGRKSLGCRGKTSDAE